MKQEKRKSSHSRNSNQIMITSTPFLNQSSIHFKLTKSFSFHNNTNTSNLNCNNLVAFPQRPNTVASLTEED